MTGSKLHLIRPLGFFLDEKSLKRSGLDYWPQISVQQYDNFAQFKKHNHSGRFFFIETDGKQTYTDVTYKKDDYLIFGSETTGLPQEILKTHPNQVIKIPMIGEDRSLNLSVAAGIVLYEALRQTGFFKD